MNDENSKYAFSEQIKHLGVEVEENEIKIIDSKFFIAEKFRIYILEIEI